MAGSAVGAGLAALGHASAYGMAGITGLLALSTFIGEPISTFIWMLIGLLAGFVVTFVLTLIMKVDTV